jgi:hypothetical protein
MHPYEVSAGKGRDIWLMTKSRIGFNRSEIRRIERGGGKTRIHTIKSSYISRIGVVFNIGI